MASSAKEPKIRAANGSAELECRKSVLAGSKKRSANKSPDWRSIRVASSAVTTLIESKKKAWKVGLLWGIGHLTGMLAIGVLFLLFKDLIPI